MAALRAAAEDKAQAAAEAAQAAKAAAKEAAAATLTSEHAEFTRLDAAGNPYKAGDIDYKVNAEGNAYDLDNSKIEFQAAESDVEASAPVEVAPVEAPVEATPVEAAPVDQAAEAVTAAKEVGKSSVEFSNSHITGGKVMLDGNSLIVKGMIEDVGMNELVAARLVPGNLHGILQGARMSESLATGLIEGEGKKIFLLKQALVEATNQGNDELKRAIFQQMRSIASDVERRIGRDVFSI